MHSTKQPRNSTVASCSRGCKHQCANDKTPQTRSYRKRQHVSCALAQFLAFGGLSGNPTTKSPERSQKRRTQSDSWEPGKEPLQRQGKTCWCSAANENWKTPTKPSNWWFPGSEPLGSIHFSLPVYRTSKKRSQRRSGLSIWEVAIR